MPKILFFQLSFLLMLIYGCSSVAANANLRKDSLKREPVIGMTKLEVKKLLGEPTSSSNFVFSSGNSDIWIYGNCPPHCAIYYFGKDGTLNNISRSKKNTY